MSNLHKLYVLGHPVAHSKSPIMHNALYYELGLDWEYALMDCKCEEDARKFIRAGDYLGLNVTTPYKPLAYECAGERGAHETAVLAQGANVLVRGGDGDCEVISVDRTDGNVHAHADAGFNPMYAFNVDGLGCVRALMREGIDIRKQRVMICGTGPTSLSIMAAVLQAGAPRVALLGRDENRAKNVLDAWRFRKKTLTIYKSPNNSNICLDSMLGFMPEKHNVKNDRAVNSGESSVDNKRIVAGSYSAHARDILNATLIIDATPLGMNAGDPTPFDPAFISPGTCVFDVVYGHGKTALERATLGAGAKYTDGEGMLVAQATLSAQIFMDSQGVSKPDFGDAFEIMEDALA